MVERLVLGTVQLGMPYGIANKTGQPKQAIATEIVHKAWRGGIKEFDTAQAYGVSEAVLGKAFADLGISKQVKVITKFDPEINHLDSLAISDSLNESLKKLGLSSLFGVMLHMEESLPLWNEGLDKILQDFVLSGKVKNLGVSVYSPNKAVRALETEGIDFIQIPTNILDQRFEKAGVFRIAKEKKKVVYIRSVFLQGLILLTSQDIPDKLVEARVIVDKFDSLCRSFDLYREEAALGFLKSQMPEAKVIFGAELPWQVEKNVELWKRNLAPEAVDAFRVGLSEVEEKILMPNLWP